MKGEKIRCRTVGDLINALKSYPEDIPLSLYAHIAAGPVWPGNEMHPAYIEEDPRVDIFVRKINSWGIDAVQIGNENDVLEIGEGTEYDNTL